MPVLFRPYTLLLAQVNASRFGMISYMANTQLPVMEFCGNSRPMAKLAKEKFLVLLVDDSEDDCLLLKLAVSRAERLHFLGSVGDGEEIVAYLNGVGKYADRDLYPVP